MQARRKVFDLAYNRRETWDKWPWVGTRTELVPPPHWCKAFLVIAHGSMDISGSIQVCCCQCPWSHGLQPKSYIILVLWRKHQLLSRSLPNGRLFRVSHRQGQELFTLPSYNINFEGRLEGKPSIIIKNSIGAKFIHNQPIALRNI